MDNTTLAPADNMTDASNWTWFDVDAFCDSIWNTVGGNNNTSINNPVNSNSSIAICALQETFAASLTTDGDPPLGSTDGATDDGISTTTTAFVLLAAVRFDVNKKTCAVFHANEQE